MRPVAKPFSSLALLYALCVAVLCCLRCDQPPPPVPAAAPASRPSVTQPASPQASAVGFRNEHLLEEHWQKHGREFRATSREQYLQMAQALRDAPVGGNVLEIVRGDGAVSRFDKISGAFIAFERNGTIRTFFRPNDGERYFRRQAQRRR